MATPSLQTYSRVAIALHWVIAVMIISMFVLANLMGNPETPNRFALYQWHKSIGITIFLLTFLRLGWRLTHRPPPLPEDMKSWERRVAKLTHIGFYVLMLGVPLLGWALVSASPLGIPTKLYGIIPWPHLPVLSGLEDKKAASEFFAKLHEIGAKLFFVLIVLHVAAALKHHFINKDNVLARMLPFIKKS